MSEVLKAAGASDASNVFLDLDNGPAIDALIAGRVDILVQLIAQPVCIFWHSRGGDSHPRIRTHIPQMALYASR
jgi:hypothetical protein